MPASARSTESILAAHFESDGQRRSEQFRRSDLKDESQPLISNLMTLCHPPGKPSGSPFRKPARSTPPSGALSEDDTCPQTRPMNPFGTNLNTPRVPECRIREHFPGCRASAPRVPELKPRPYPVDFPTTLRVLSERDTYPRVPPADKTLRKPPELATRSECLNSKLPRKPSESPRVPSRRPPGCHLAARESPRKTLPDARGDSRAA